MIVQRTKPRRAATHQEQAALECLLAVAAAEKAGTYSGFSRPDREMALALAFEARVRGELDDEQWGHVVRFAAKYAKQGAQLMSQRATCQEPHSDYPSGSMTAATPGGPPFHGANPAPAAEAPSLPGMASPSIHGWPTLAEVRMRVAGLLPDPAHDDPLLACTPAPGLPKDPAQWTAEQASWVLRLLGQLAADAERASLPYRREVERLQASLDGLEVRAAREREWWERGLSAWLSAHPPARGKSVDLPGGRLGWRKSPDRLEVEDESIVLQWARSFVASWTKDMPLEGKILAEKIIKKEESLSKSALNEWHKKTGEVPPGARWVEGEDQFYASAHEREEVP